MFCTGQSGAFGRKVEGMANDFFENQFILDTPSVNLIKQSLAYNAPFLRIKGIRWIGTGAAGDACVIQAANNKVYWEAVAGLTNYAITDTIERMWQQDFKLTTLTSGRVYIYLADKWG